MIHKLWLTPVVDTLCGYARRADQAGPPVKGATCGASLRFAPGRPWTGSFHGKVGSYRRGQAGQEIWRFKRQVRNARLHGLRV